MTIHRCKQALACSVLFLLAVSGLHAQLDPTSTEGAKAAVLAGSISQVAFLNLDRVTRCDGAIRNFNLNMASGQAGVNSTPPVAPFAWELAPPNQDGFVFYQISTVKKLVCNVPISTFNAGAPQAPKPPNVIDVGPAIFGKWHSVGPNDTFPPGMTTPPMADGALYQKFGAPVGPGWYLQVN
jgi:hypothetical protein